MSPSKCLATCLLLISSAPFFSCKATSSLAFTLTPAEAGPQLVRLSLPFSPGFLKLGQGLKVSAGRVTSPIAIRPLTFYPASGRELPSVRRGLVAFPWTFTGKQPVPFVLHPSQIASEPAARFPALISVAGDKVTVAYTNGPRLEASLIAPARISTTSVDFEQVESNAFFCWSRYSFADPEWPRIIEVRADCLGGILIQAHLQRGLPGDSRAPDLGWDFTLLPRDQSCFLEQSDNRQPVTASPLIHSFSNNAPCTLCWDNARYCLYSPAAPFKRRGHFKAQSQTDSLHCRYFACTSTERVPMQQAAWRRAEFVVAPAGLARLTPALQLPHSVAVDWRAWDQLYDSGPPCNLDHQPELASLLRYHHEATIRCAAAGDDWGNVTSYADGATTGGVFGMNRLNHCAPIFEEAYRSGDARLLQTALLWCDNFYDQSIWWGPTETGGTRYNNLVAMGQKAPDNDQSFMWRSTNSVSFCTKGYDAFFYAWEATGDPRMKQALDAQLAYAARYLHAGENYTRNVGDVRDFIRLYRFTGEAPYLCEAQRLFRELRTQLSTGDLFTESGHAISPNPPFIVDDQAGYKNPFAKPYIIGYALAGLPELTRLTPNEPKLHDVVKSVADFLAESQDPVGGWRYPHPRSPNVIMSQALEHAWQLVQADRALGAKEKHLDAIERVLRQRLQGWRKTGKMFSGLTCWEIATGKVKQPGELASLYQHPGDRDSTRDYSDGRADFGSAPPEGIVYFPEVLAFYLKHRPASRLLAAPAADEPLGRVLAKY